MSNTIIHDELQHETMNMLGKLSGVGDKIYFSVPIDAGKHFAAYQGIVQAIPNGGVTSGTIKISASLDGTEYVKSNFGNDTINLADGQRHLQYLYAGRKYEISLESFVPNGATEITICVWIY